MGSTSFSTTEKMGCTWVVLPQTVNAENVRLVEENIRSCHTDTQQRLVLDLSQVDFLYSAAMGLLIRLRQAFGNGPDSVALVNVSAKIRQSLETVNLNKLFRVYATDVEFEVSEGDVWEQNVSCSAPRFIVVSQIEDSVCHIVLSGHMTTFNDLSKFDETICPESAGACVIDVSNVSFIDSMGVGRLLGFLGIMRTKSVRTAVFGANDSIREMFGFVSIDEFVQLFETEEQALRAVSGETGG